jgi:hypothetical protein
MDEDKKIENLKKKLEDPEFFKNTKLVTEHFVYFEDPYKAKVLLESIEGVLSEIKKREGDIPESLKKYLELITSLKIVAFPLLSSKEVLSLLKEKLLVALDSDFPLIEKIRKFLIFNFFYPEERDEFRRRIREVLLKNEEKISSSPFKKGKEVVPYTVGNLLRDYNSVFGTERVDKIKQAEYFVKNTAGLNEKEKEMVRKILELYEYLKISSLTPEGYEGSIPIKEGDKLMVLREGRLETIDPKIINFVKEYWPKAVKAINEYYASLKSEKEESDKPVEPKEPKNLLEEKYFEEESKE